MTSGDDNRWLLYGANGYTGTLIAELALRTGAPMPVLAGRREAAIRPLAERLGTTHRIFSLDDRSALRDAVGDVRAVLLAAGPFSATSRPVVDACLEVGSHYLDITGEISVFEACHRREAHAKRAGSVLMPGVGFDVVPSDCLAASLARAMPDAQHLELAILGIGAPSRGTLKTSVEALGAGGLVRRGGRMTRVPTAWRTKTIRFPSKSRLTMTTPWGDVATAYYSTGIPDIEVYMAFPPRMIRAARAARRFERLLSLGPVQRMLKSQIDRRPAGPDAHARETGRAELWGRVESGAKSLEGTLVTPEGYKLTAETALESTLRVLRGEVKPGAPTPSMAFGADYIERFEGCDLQLGEIDMGAIR